jgi:Protein of unknown function (DUF3102)
VSDILLSNSLADLSARIKAEHRATSDALRSSVEHSMAAGDLLIEAKELVPHGQWLPWLAQNCELSERSSQLYMRTAKNREAIELQIRNGVADLTLNEAAALLFLTSDVKKLLAFAKQASEISDPEKLIEFCVENDVGVIRDNYYDMWAGTTDEQKWEWTLYALFLVAHNGSSPEGAACHIEWLRQRPFISVEEWVGEEGANFRKRCGMRQIGQVEINAWPDFLACSAGLSLAEIEAEMLTFDERPFAAAPLRRKKKSRRGAK